MVALTEQLALSRARADSMADVRSLNLWGNGLTEVWTQKDGLNAYEWHYCITREELHYEMPMHSSIAVVLEKRKSAHPSHTNAVATNVEILSLSVNKISSLSAFRHCHKLRELYLRKNRIASLKELVHLIKSPDGGKSGTVSDTLQVLWLCDNPCAMEEEYRGKVIALLPALTKLDNQNVSKKEREDAMRRELGSKLLDEILKGIESTQEQQKEKDATPEVDDTAEAPADDECRRSGNDDSSAASRIGDEGVETSNDEKQALSVQRPQTSSNTLYAVMALVADLDLESLRIVQSEIDHRVEEALENHQ